VGDEIIQAGVATDVGDGKWTLTRLLRGRRGTEWAAKHLKGWSETTDHTQFERAFFLGDVADANKADVKAIPLSDRNVEYVHKAVTVNVPDDGLNKLFTNTGRSHKPWSPVDVDGTKSGNDWVFTWTRRNRIGSSLASGTGLPETDPAIYEIDILDELGTIVRTLNATTETVTYTQAQQEADFGGTIVTSYPLYRINIGVYQVNAETVGRGFVGVGHIEDFPAAPTDASFSSVSLLLHMNSLTVMDKSSNSLPVTTGSGVTLLEGDYWDITTPTLDTDETLSIKTSGVSQYGTAALEFRNVSDSILTIDRADLGTLFDLGSGEFTVEIWWRRLNVLPQGGHICGIWDTGIGDGREWSFAKAGQGGNGRIEFFWSTDGTSGTDTSFIGDMPDQDIGLGHAAIVRSSNTFMLFANGERLNTSDATGITIYSGSTADFTIGRRGDGGQVLRSDIDALRVTDGVARYTGATYTVPATMFPNS
jgi:hypothetical protein